AQIREILISESAWEEMTCLFAPSLDTSASVLIPEAARVWMRQDERATKADEITRDGFQEFGDLKIKKI
ncbi:hypothetical protein ACTZMY_27325, partial [Klebsiella pneumoniae]